MKRARSEEETMMSRIFGKEIISPDEHEMTPAEAALVERVEKFFDRLFAESQQLDPEAKARILKAAMGGLASRPSKPLSS